MLQLTAEEQAWLDSCRAALNEQHRGRFKRCSSTAQRRFGQAHAESDLDLLFYRQKQFRQAENRAEADRLPISGKNRGLTLDSLLTREKSADDDG